MAPKPASQSSRAPRSGTMVLGTKRFDKISAVEGLRPSASMLKVFKDMDQRGLSGDERVRFLKAKFGRSPSGH